MKSPTCKEMKKAFILGCTLSCMLFTGAQAQVGGIQPMSEYRTIDGSNNNLANPDWGSSHVQLLRDVPVAYADGVSALAGPNRASARVISNIVNDQSVPIPSPVRASDYLWQWGQWLDHDLDLTDPHMPPEPAPIPVPLGDAFFDPNNTGTQTLPFNRSLYDILTGTGTNNPRQQINELTSWIDASNVYGSDEQRASALRTNDGTGRLLTSAGNLLPFNTLGLPNAGGTDPNLFVAGDIRSNEQVALTAMHTLWLREHNRQAALIAAQNPGLSGDQIFEEARARVGALQQVITYKEFLPLLLGQNTLSPYQGYNPNVDGTVRNSFSAAVFRVGHTMLSGMILRLDENRDIIPEGNLPLRDAFFNPQLIVDHGIEPLLRGLAAQPSQAIDAFVVDDVRNFLFGAPGQGGMDLPALNIQRGRDHGLGSYNATRIAYGLPPRTSFDQINTNPMVRERLEQAYDTVDDIDLWVGAIAERTASGALVGETLQTVMKAQFEAVRDGDRFWYQRVFSGQELVELDNTTLADVIIRNTPIEADEIPANVFIAQLPADGTISCILGTIDVWNNGFVLNNITVTNNTDSTITNWSANLSFENPIGMVSVWNANGSLSGNTVTATNVSYNGTLAPGQSATWGMQGTHNGNFSVPVCSSN
ncbi:MAG TPA: peroxidase family protein [Gammaproteobacteria bacterium]